MSEPMDTFPLVPKVSNGRVPHERAGLNSDLEQGLEEVYEESLKFPYEHAEVTFLQTGIEHLVETIVADLTKNKHLIFDQITNRPIIGFDTLDENHENVVNRIGSFYEQTRNTFPDEFDFVYSPYRLSSTDESFQDWKYHTNEEAFKKRISYLANSGRLIYRDEEVGDLFYASYAGKQGITSKLKFTFVRSLHHYRRSKSIRLKKKISVTLVAGITLIDPNLADHVDRMCVVPEFRQCIIESASFRYLLLEDSYTAFANSEIHFMTNILSKKHVKAYMLVKHLINGHKSRNELLKLCSKSKHSIYCEIPSYAIKTAIIRHHYNCSNASNNCSPCVLSVLDMFLLSFFNPIAKMDENEKEFHYVEVATLSNKCLTLASGPEQFVEGLHATLKTFINYLTNYRKRGRGFNFDPLSTHFTRWVKTFEMRNASKVRRARADICDNFGADNMATCCYNIIIALCVFAFAVAIIYICVKES
ncbi:uncharacterized protein LOC128207545 [Mya arenaria]|uniref:uncharacterized protein LOC128207545 n=1 Tax=Mya arenaria TaxID=6604 RepID=UPI0022E8DA1B|nr:uncharacterized protein LOC128207545 [Mya arenaria]